MNTSQTTIGLFKPTADKKIPLGTFAYINARNRQRAYDIVIREFEASGITQVTLADRMGKSPEVVCRLLSRPQNWESDTFSSLLFAISGAVPKYGLTYLFGKQEIVENSIFEVKNLSTASTISTTSTIVRLDDYRPGEFRPARTA
jgi:hypothetical protein